MACRTERTSYRRPYSPEFASRNTSPVSTGSSAMSRAISLKDVRGSASRVSSRSALGESAGSRFRSRRSDPFDGREFNEAFLSNPLYRRNPQGFEAFFEGDQRKFED